MRSLQRGLPGAGSRRMEPGPVRSRSRFHPLRGGPSPPGRRGPRPLPSVARRGLQGLRGGVSLRGKDARNARYWSRDGSAEDTTRRSSASCRTSFRSEGSAFGSRIRRWRFPSESYSPISKRSCVPAKKPAPPIVRVNHHPITGGPQRRRTPSSTIWTMSCVGMVASVSSSSPPVSWRTRAPVSLCTPGPASLYRSVELNR